MWLREAFSNPPARGGKGSMARVCAFLLTLITAYAVWRNESATVITALVGGGIVAILLRDRCPEK